MDVAKKLGELNVHEEVAHVILTSQELLDDNAKAISHLDSGRLDGSYKTRKMLLNVSENLAKIKNLYDSLDVGDSDGDDDGDAGDSNGGAKD